MCEEGERCKNNAALWQGMLCAVQPALSHPQPAWLKEQSRTTFLKGSEKIREQLLLGLIFQSPAPTQQGLFVPTVQD